MAGVVDPSVARRHRLNTLSVLNTYEKYFMPRRRLAAEAILSSGSPCVYDHKLILKVCERDILQTACEISLRYTWALR